MQDSIVFKVIVLGQQGVGKSSVLIRYTKGQFSPQYVVTLGVEFLCKSVQIDHKTNVKLQIWDTAGQQTFRAIVRSFYKGIAGVFLIYAIDSISSFNAIRQWHKEVKESAHQEVVFFLVGCRADLEQKRQVSSQSANKLLQQIGGVLFIQTSAKTGLNIQELFQRTGKIIFKKLVRPLISPGYSQQRKQSFTITQAHKSNLFNNKRCC